MGHPTEAGRLAQIATYESRAGGPAVRAGVYSTHKISAALMHFHIPLGTYQRLRVVDAQGKRVRFHYRVRLADVLVEWVRQKTKERLPAKAEGMFAGGATVEFAAVRVHRTEGVTARLWYGTKKMKWEEITSCEIGEGVVFRSKLRRLGGGYKLSGDRVANVHVLGAMLGRIFQERDERQRGEGHVLEWQAR